MKNDSKMVIFVHSEKKNNDDNFVCLLKLSILFYYKIFQMNKKKKFNRNV